MQYQHVIFFSRDKKNKYVATRKALARLAPTPELVGLR